MAFGQNEKNTKWLNVTYPGCETTCARLRDSKYEPFMQNSTSMWRISPLAGVNQKWNAQFVFKGKSKGESLAGQTNYSKRDVTDTFQIDKRLRSSSIIFDQSFIWTFWIVFNSRVRTCFKVPAIVIKVTGGMVHYARTWSPGRPTQSVKTKTWGKVESQFPAPSFSGYSATFVQPVPLLNGRCPRHCITTALSTAPASQSIQTVYCVLY